MFIDGMCSAAREHGVWVSVGVHEAPMDADERCYNTQLLIDSRGEICERYRKVCELWLPSH